MGQTNNVAIENARIGFKNFTGKEGRFNPAGSRNFCVFLEEDLAKSLAEEGWNVRWLKAREEGEPDQGYVQVSVRYNAFPPKIVMISKNGQRILDEESVSLLDWADITNVDLIMRPYNWDVGKIKAYVKSMYVNIYEDEFEQKWLNTPDSADNSTCDDCASINGSCMDCKRCNED